MPASDLELVARAKSGNARAVSELIERHERRVYRFGLRMCGNEEDARDVLQETLLAAFKNLHTFRGDAMLSTWLFQLARSFCVKQRRRKSFTPEELTESKAEVPPSATEVHTHARELGEVIQVAMSSLPLDFREAVVLRDVEGLSAQEAADVAGIELAAHKSRLHRARVRLREQLSAVLDDDQPTFSCPGLREALAAYAVSDIDEAACVSLEVHLDGCPTCSASCESLKRTVSLCKALPGGDVPAPVKAAVRRAVRLSLAAAAEPAHAS